MRTAWSRVWTVGRFSIDATVDLCSFMVGLAWGRRDVVIHIGIATVIIEHWRAE